MKIRGKKLWRDFWPYLVLFLISLALIAPQILTQSTIIGSDALFHFNRFYDAAKQIQTGKFSYFQTNFGFQQSGRLINGMYGPLFAYANGLLLLITHSWFNYELSSSLILFMVGGCGMYRLTQFLKSPRWIGILVTTMFMSCGWMPYWTLGQNMMTWGAALTPYALLIAIKMIQEPDNAIHVIPLSLIMAIISQIHILSTLMFVLLFIPFFLYSYIHTTNKKKICFQLIKAIGITIPLTANIWGSFLVMYSENYIASPGAFKLSKNALMFAFLPGFRNYLNFVLISILLFQIIWIIVHWGKNKINSFTTVIGLLFMWVSSVLFPWALLDKLTPKLESTLQFPVRFDVIAYPLIFAGLIMSLNQLNLKKRWTKNLMYASLFAGTLILASSTIINVVHRSIIYQREGLNSWAKTRTIAENPHEIQWTTTSGNPGNLLILVDKSHPDYLPIPYPEGKKLKRSTAYENQIIKPYRFFYHKVTKNGKLVLVWKTSHSGKQRIPIITYAETSLELNGRHIQRYEVSDIGAPLLNIKKGMNQLSISFVTPKYFRLLLIITLIAWLIMLLWLIKIKHTL